MTKKLHVFFVLDETGSMLSCLTPTISGFNEYIQTLKGDKKVDYLFSLMKFNSESITQVYSQIPIKNVETLSVENYRPRATTPLYDAIGRGIASLTRKRHVLFVIQTDGQENASREYTREKIFRLIEKKTKKGWQFVFLGADQDAWDVGAQLGLSKGQTLSYDSVNTKAAFRSVAQSSVSYASASAGVSTEDFFDDTDIRGGD
jgi:hypothetical protein